MMKFAGIFWGMPKFVGIFGGLKSGLRPSPCSRQKSECTPAGGGGGGNLDLKYFHLSMKNHQTSLSLSQYASNVQVTRR